MVERGRAGEIEAKRSDLATERGDPATVEGLLATAREGISRFTPAGTIAAVERGAVLVDIRQAHQRERDGLLPGAAVVERNVLEWRLDPRGAHRDPRLAREDVPIILICDEGYQSSLAAAVLRRFGLDAGDVVGGVQAWIEDGLPLATPQSRMRDR